MRNYVQFFILTLGIILSNGTAAAQESEAERSKRERERLTAIIKERGKARKETKTPVDGFGVLKFGMSMAQCRQIILAKNAGTINEERSNRFRLVISSWKLDYDFGKHNKLWQGNQNMVTLLFVADKFYKAAVSLPDLPETDNLSKTLERVKKDLDERYYETTELVEDDEYGLSSSYMWEFSSAGTRGINQMFLSGSGHEVSLVVLNSSLAGEANSLDTAHEMAREFLKKGNGYSALIYLAKVIAIDPNYGPDIYFERGYAYSLEGEHDKAITDFSTAIGMDPGDETYYIFRGISHGAKGNYGPAIADLNKAIQMKPNASGAYAVRAEVFCKQGQKALAAADEEKAIALGRVPKSRCQ